MLLKAFIFSGYLILFVPVVVISLVARFFPMDQADQGNADKNHPVDKNYRLRLYVLLGCTAFSLGLLDVLIWFNPYGREINSSLSAIGLMPVVVALLAFCLRRWRDIARLWPTDKILLVPLGLIGVVLLAFLWLAEQSTFYITTALTVLLVLVWWATTGWSTGLLTILSLVILGFLLLGGGAFYTPTLHQPTWLRSTVELGAGFSIWLAIPLAAGLVYASLRPGMRLTGRELAWRVGLIAILLAGIIYQVYWDGIWSSAHARAFEDHLPFVHFLISLLAGVLLLFTLRGWRRIAGPGFILVVTTLAVLALTWGWKVSAFELTEHRAAQVDQAVKRYFQEHNSYPADLAALIPRYLLVQLPPVVVRQGGWCYQGGQDYYRLGYISGKFTYSRADFVVKVHAQAGNLPEGGWFCDELVSKFKAKELNY